LKVLRWRLLIEEFDPQFKYIPGHKNIVADTLSHLDIDEDLDQIVQHEELFGLSKEELPYALPKHAYPFKFSTSIQ